MDDWIADVEAYLMSVAPLTVGDRVTHVDSDVTGEICEVVSDQIYKVYWGTSDNGRHETFAVRNDLVVAQTLPA